MLMFLGVPESSGGTSKFRLAGVYSDALSLSYNPVTEESQDVTEVASTTDVTGYALNIPVSTKVVAKEVFIELENYNRELKYEA